MLQCSVLDPEEFIAYTDDVKDLIGRHHLSRHLYAENTQLIDEVRIIQTVTATADLSSCLVKPFDQQTVNATKSHDRN